MLSRNKKEESLLTKVNWNLNFWKTFEISIGCKAFAPQSENMSDYYKQSIIFTMCKYHKKGTYQNCHSMFAIHICICHFNKQNHEDCSKKNRFLSKMAKCHKLIISLNGLETGPIGWKRVQIAQTEL